MPAGNSSVLHRVAMLLAPTAGRAWPALASDSAQDPVADMTAALRWLAPAWSPRQQAASPGAPDAVTPLRIPGSTQSVSALKQLEDALRAVDWWPQDHPLMPSIVERSSTAPASPGRSPTYITRRLVQFRLGCRREPYSEAMQKVVAPRTLNEMISPVTYTATFKP